MRVIAGKYKKRNLVSVSGHTSRPTTDFVKETMFSIIQSVDGQSVLDLYAGSGSLGIEALSRGAISVDFVENSDNAISSIMANVKNIGIASAIHIYKRRVSAFISKSEKNYDLIFMDPPYDKGLIQETVDLIASTKILNDTGKIVIERYFKEELKLNGSLSTVYEKKYGSTIIQVLEKAVIDCEADKCSDNTGDIANENI